MSPNNFHQDRGRFRRVASRVFVGATLCWLGSFAGLAAAGTNPVLVGVIFPSQNQARWAIEEKIFVARAQANGDKVIFQYSDESAVTQKNQVESMIQRGVKSWCW